MPTTKNTATDDRGSDTEVSVTLKGGAGYDAPWVVLRAPDVATARTLVDDEENLTPLLDSAAKAGKYFSGLNAPVQTAAASSSSSGGEGRTCKHGAMQWKSGFSSSTGKAWQGWFCPSPKGTPDQCKPEFTR